MTDPKRVVRTGWDRASRIYRPEGAADDRFGHSDMQYRAWIRPIVASLPRGTPVLDLGCGCGLPASQILAESFQVTGVDLSDVQIERAREQVPNATFRCADMTAIEFPAGSMAAVVSLYALIHVPRAEQRPLLGRIHGWLRPGGRLLLLTGAKEWQGTEENWLGSGATMYWDHADASTYRDWLRSAGFAILEERFIPEAGSGHELFWARKPEAPSDLLDPRDRRRSAKPRGPPRGSHDRRA